MPRPAFRGGVARVRVPATSANLGPGFDTLGLALGLFDDVVARIADSGLEIDVAGEGADDVKRDEGHLVVRAMRATFDRLGGQPPGLELVCANRIPHGRGLGSSSAAIVAGVLLARSLVLAGDAALDDDAALGLATELEGHPDNVAPCLLGGLTVAWNGADGVVGALSLAVAADVRPIVFIPPFESSTAEVRRLLPTSVPLADAVFNAARSALLVPALTMHPEHLLAATDDRLHQPYRAPAMLESAALVGDLRSADIPAVISGAGPTVLALTRTAAESDAAAALVPLDWRVEALAVQTTGAVVSRG